MRAINNEIFEETYKQLKDIEFALEEASIVAITDYRGRIIYVNEKFSEISQYSKEELIGSTHSIINSGYHSSSFFKEMWRTIGTGHVWKGEIKNKAKDGSFYWVDTTIVPFLNEKGRPYQYIAVRNDITSRKEAERKIQQMAYYDKLTGTLNRNGLNNKLAEILQEPEDTIALLFIDLDRFKLVNDTYGHQFGDNLLKMVSERLKESVPSESTISRYAGDEFVIVLSAMTEEKVNLIVEQMIQNFNEPFYIADEYVYISASIGISMASADEGATVSDLIKDADTAMYDAKDSGKNNYKFFNAELNKINHRKMKVVKNLREAIAKNRLHLHYQSQIDLDTGEMIGVEALVRWSDPVLGRVSPGEFIPLAEDMGLITSLGDWVLKRACEQNKEWQDCGFKKVRVAVNVSVRQMQEKNFVKKVKKVLDDTGLDPQYLELEITESIVQDVHQSIKVLKELKQLGVYVAIDDFGTGYSSLSVLTDLPVDSLKIDQSFIRNIGATQKSSSIIRTIIDMGHNLRFQIIAEGIEEERHKNFLKQERCHIGQGYFFSRPVPPQDMKEFLKENS